MNSNWQTKKINESGIGGDAGEIFIAARNIRGNGKIMADGGDGVVGGNGGKITLISDNNQFTGGVSVKGGQSILLNKDMEGPLKKDLLLEIAEIKQIMLDVSTGIERIQNVNERYVELFNKIDEFCLNNGIKNPNPYSDLWEFHAYWSKNLPHYTDRRVCVTGIYKNFNKINRMPFFANDLVKDGYVNVNRLEEIKKIKSEDYDLSKLTKICEEINFCYQNECYLAVIVLLRSLLNHVPPIFSFSTFDGVCGGYGKKSFKDIVLKLNESSRKIADSYLHDPIRRKETLPNKTQVNFSQELDYLLSEIISLLN